MPLGRYLILLLVLVAVTACAGSPAQDENIIRFAFGGDLAGQNVCRDAESGFPIFEHVLAAEPRFFVALGDMIYADQECKAVGLYGNPQVPRATGVASSDEEFNQHWEYVREDPGFSRVLEEMPYFAVWDDHEARNDFGPSNVDPELLSAARRAFAGFADSDPRRLFFNRRFGTHLEMFFLDTRSYRDPNGMRDTPERPKTMLGPDQRAWLTEGVSSSAATWKIVVTSVPLSIPTGWPAEEGRDGWANYDQETGFELELSSLLRAFADAGVRNLVFLSADVHCATGLRYTPFSDRPGFTFHEFVTGPLHAGLFPVEALDDTLRPERLFFYGPPSPEAVEDFKTALRWFNFGLIEIDSDGALRFQLIDGYGSGREEVRLEPGSTGPARVAR